MINGAKVFQTRSDLAQLARMDANLQCHIDLLETAIAETNDPKEKEKGRAAIRRLQAGIDGTLRQ